jgi:hypothetical protein
VSTFDDVCRILEGALQPGARAQKFQHGMRLLGALPEFDSMTVVSVITAIEAYYDITVHDDEIGADTFETVGTLVAFIDRKLKLS